jgi:hypothetical protein
VPSTSSTGSNTLVFSLISILVVGGLTTFGAVAVRIIITLV